MSVKTYLRGHLIVKTEDGWVYEDTGELALPSDDIRPCKKCGRKFSLEERDCLGNLPGVDNACCGHGIREEAYIRFTDGTLVRGFIIENLRNEEMCRTRDLHARAEQKTRGIPQKH